MSGKLDPAGRLMLGPVDDGGPALTGGGSRGMCFFLFWKGNILYTYVSIDVHDLTADIPRNFLPSVRDRRLELKLSKKLD